METSKIYNCSLILKPACEDNHIYNFDDSWNITLGGFQIQNTHKNKLQLSFSFEANLETTDGKGNRVFEMPHEELAELQPHLENLEVLLDILSFQTGLPLIIEDGSFEFSGGGYSTKSGPVVNTISLQDFPGLEKRYQNLSKKEELVNAFRFFRLAQIDKEANGKGVKLWATLEALYKGYEKNIKPIWQTLSKFDQGEIVKGIESLNLDSNKKEQLLKSVKERKLMSKTEMLSKKIKLMSSDGEYTENQIKKLVQFWSSSRHNPAHGTRIKKADEEKEDALNDLERTLEMLLGDTIRPSLTCFFIGDPDDLNGKFWDKKDYTIKKINDHCWLKPSNLVLGTHDQILLSIGSYRISNNNPFLYVTHNKVISLDKDSLRPVTNLDELPMEFKEITQKTQERLNEERDKEDDSNLDSEEL